MRTLGKYKDPRAARMLEEVYQLPARKPQGVDDATAVQRGVAGVQGRYAKYKLEGPDAKWGTIPNEDARWQVMVDEALLGGSFSTQMHEATRPTALAPFKATPSMLTEAQR